MKIITRINRINGKGGYWSERIYAELRYALKLSKVNTGSYDAAIERAVSYLEERIKFEGVITKSAVLEAEKILSPIETAAGKYTVICAAHAHIDMNWMWDYAETAGITLETFKTMLNLMEEYPDFKFSQSQASVYRIVEELDPDMLEEIKKRIAEGRWEVAATTWVEADKNMPNGESHARHLLYTKRYLKQLLNLSDDDFLIDYEPDTFGHNENVPETLSKAGVKYYYHCRGHEGHQIFKWEAPSGESVIAFRDPVWYNLEISPDMVLHIPELCEKYGLESMLYVYGVGDHGGGPTRRDIERLKEMGTWPIFPKIRFGTYKEFFTGLSKNSDKLPVVKGELNVVFTGCYTSQSRIKKANRVCENRLYDSECSGALKVLAGTGNGKQENYEKAWRRVLFNQFHDILTGSGVIDTREYAMGEYQKTIAEANTGFVRNLRAMACEIDTSSLAGQAEDYREAKSEGAGVGFGMDDMNPPRTERGRGKRRVYHLFNTSGYDRNENVEITIWDWDGDHERMIFTDPDGNNLEHDMPKKGRGNYWNHDYVKVLVRASIPAFGYTTVLLDEAEADDFKVDFPDWPRIESFENLVLENDSIKVEFDRSMRIISYMDKKRDMDLADGSRPAGFIYAREQDENKMSSWTVGRYKQSMNPPGPVEILTVENGDGLLRKRIKYEQEILSSKMTVEVILDRDSSGIIYMVECDWREIADRGNHIPRLEYRFPLSFECREYVYDVPFGVIRRKSNPLEAPGNSWIGAMTGNSGNAVMIVTNSKYGYKGDDNSLTVSLIRSSCDPDPYPEVGIHKFGFAVNALDGSGNNDFIREAVLFNNHIGYMGGSFKKGTMPMLKSIMKVEGDNIALSAVKTAEYEKNAIVFRVYETEGRAGKVKISFNKKPVTANTADIHENPSEGQVRIDGNSVLFDIKANSIETIIVKF